MNKLRIHLIAGARPNFMKIAPIIRALKNHSDSVHFQLIHTGQHYDASMSDVFFEELEIPDPDYHLNVGSGSHADQTAKIMMAYEPICISDQPDVVLVVGDVNSTVACSLVAKKLNIKVAHVEAGLRSGDMEMPEEINRIITDSITDYYFVTEQSGIDNLLAEGKPEKNIHFVGHVMIDNLLYQVEKLKTLDKNGLVLSEKIKKQYPEYGVVTLHRPSNVDDEKSLSDIIAALSEISQKIPLIFPIHPRTENSLKEFELTLPETIITTKALPYMEFLNLFKDANIVLTDSGGLQEETTALGVPCLTMRGNTERPVTITEGTNKIVGASKQKIISEAASILETKIRSPKKPDLWDGDAAKRITKVLIS